MNTCILCEKQLTRKSAGTLFCSYENHNNYISLGTVWFNILLNGTPDFMYFWFEYMEYTLLCRYFFKDEKFTIATSSTPHFIGNFTLSENLNIIELKKFLSNIDNITNKIDKYLLLK